MSQYATMTPMREALYEDEPIREAMIDHAILDWKDRVEREGYLPDGEPTVRVIDSPGVEVDGEMVRMNRTVNPETGEEIELPRYTIYVQGNTRLP